MHVLDECARVSVSGERAETEDRMRIGYDGESQRGHKVAIR